MLSYDEKININNSNININKNADIENVKKIETKEETTS